MANPSFQFQFSKGYYSRIANKYMGGRVSRLLVTPLIRALEHTLDKNHQEYLLFMDSFRYPLAGEFSMRKDAMAGLRLPSDWGLEVGVLMEMLRNYSTRRICQVDIADIYDHKHQSLSQDNDQAGLSKMSIDITKAFFRKLATDGVVFNNGLFRTLKATYLRIGLDLVDSYRCDARMNDSILMSTLRSRWSSCLQEPDEGWRCFHQQPARAAFYPHWNRVVSAIPDIYEQLIDAVEKDHQMYGG